MGAGKEAGRHRRNIVRPRPPSWRARCGLLLACAALLATGLGAIQLAPDTASTPPVGISAARASAAAAALREAVAAAEAGDRALAQQRLAAVADGFPILAAVADLLRLRLHVEAGEFAAALQWASATRDTSEALASEWHELRGDALDGLGRSSDARAAWERALEASSDSDRIARLRKQRARSFVASGDLARAMKEYLALWTRHPETEAAEVADAALDALARRTGVEPRDGKAFRQRGDAFFRARDNEAALAAYESALAFEDLSRVERRRAARQRAHTLFRLRRYTLAVEAYGGLPSLPEYRIERARAVARAGDPEQGARDLEALAAITRGSDSLRALYLAALLWDGEDRSDRARPLFEKVARKGRGTSFANAALWHLGWADYRAGDLAAAIVRLEELEGRERDPITALRARYWLARARSESGDFDTARRGFEAIVREFPFSYYGWRARQRIGALPRTDPPLEIPAGTAVLSPDDVALPRILIDAGLEAMAARELDVLHDRASGLHDRLALANLYATTGAWHPAQRLVVAAYSESLARGPVPSQVELWWHAWPAPYAEAMNRATGNGARIEPGLVYALMREESGYRPAVVSVSGARGLMQIMPDTGARLARDLGLTDYDADRLFVPDVNIRMGSYYLQTLLQRFPGRVSAAVASYNAGPEAVSRWTDADLDDDEWVETIPYDQTRTYVKRVLRSLYAYRVLY